MSKTKKLPDPATVAVQIESCRRELKALQRLHRLCKSVSDIERERRARKSEAGK
jgi:hypothetical protein